MSSTASRCLLRTIALVLILLSGIAFPSCALYDFEGVPLTTIAEGQIQGDLMTFSSLGLDAPPRECRFELPASTEWARIYAGVWGGTEKYKGWIQFNVNGKSSDKITLYGTDDQTQNVYSSGHGVYWVAKDATSLLKKGDNTVIVTTSRGEQGNKLDGRVYGIVVVAAVKQPGDSVTRYWVAEGNENLHGEGWSGTNPTRHLTANVTFTGAETQNILRANLTTVLLASNSGQPDYLTFNTRDLGQPITGSANYPEGSRDIGNERSFDAGGGSGVDSRYMDLEVQNVAPFVQGTNTVAFELGRDLNQDGTISTTGQKPEGEDYIHPCLALLTITTGGSPSSGPDLLIENIRAVNTFDGANGTITATLRNRGTPLSSPAQLTFRIDQADLWKGAVVPDSSGIQQVTAPWTAVAGTHIVEVEVQGAGDTDSSNDLASTRITVGTLPDLVVSAGTPYRSGAATKETPRSPAFVLVPLVGIGLVFLFTRRQPPQAGALFMISLILLLGLSPLIMVPASADGGAVAYMLPVEIVNRGGSDAPAFDLTIYLDGERSVTKTIASGVAAGGVQRLEIPLFTTPGRHTIRIVADEARTIMKKDTSQNAFEQSLEFT